VAKNEGCNEIKGLNESVSHLECDNSVGLAGRPGLAEHRKNVAGNCCILQPTMTLHELYPLARAAHIGLVLTSGALFAARGWGVQRGAGWPMALAVRRISYAIDTALLSAALLLLVILDTNPFVTAWLSVKIGLLLLYIVLGSLALKRAPTRGLRMVSLLAALLCLGFMLTVALAHHPLGVFARVQFIPQLSNSVLPI